MSRAPELDWDRVGLGTKPDPELARELGVRTDQVRHQRCKRGIPILLGPPTRWAHIDWDRVGLGTKPDSELARELGVPDAVIRRRRTSRGIPIVYKAPCVDWGTVGLGLRPDDVIAAELGVKVDVVGKHRRRLKIPSYRALMGTARAVGGICQGFYWLGRLERRLEGCCVLPRCLRHAQCIAAFLVRGDAIALQVCSDHGRLIEAWALDGSMGEANRGLVQALRLSGGAPAGRMHGELGVG